MFTLFDTSTNHHSVQILHLLHVCGAVSHSVILSSCPFHSNQNFRPWWRTTDPLTFLKWQGTSALWSKNFWLKVKILWFFGDVMSGWPLSPEKSRMSHSKRAVATIAPLQILRLISPSEPERVGSLTFLHSSEFVLGFFFSESVRETGCCPDFSLY